LKFWQRAYLSILVLFIACFYISIFMVSNFAYRTGLNGERERSFGEAGFIAASIKHDLDMAVITRKGGDNAADDKTIFYRYTNYYKNRNIYLELWKNGLYLSGNIPDSPMKEYEAGYEEQISMIVEYSQKKYSLVSGSFMCDSDNYTLIYTHDLQGFTNEHNTLVRFLIISGAVITFLLAVGLYILLRRLSKPIENLDEATGRISNGDYSMRIPSSGKDEFAALAIKFNSMADVIESKIHELQISAEQKQRFIDNLAHELRTPLTTIRGYAEYLKNANINEDDKITSIDYIVSEAVRIEEMAVKLLDLALLRNNSIELVVIDVPDLFNAVKSKLSLKLSTKNISLEINCGQGSIMGDRVLLESMLYNLLDNAIKASQEGASIFLSNTMENGNCTVVIQDFGKGMSEEHIEKLKEPFYRIDKARSRSEGGTGLGLALCEQIAELHKAGLVFSSETGKGTTTKISFTTS